jgi:extradiol dioxygenase family protein
MKVKGLDHVVIKTEDVDRLLEFYRDVMGLDVLREEEFRQGRVGFVSVRVSPEIILDLSPASEVDRAAPNMDHFCLVLEPTDMEELRRSLKSRGVEVDADVHPAFGAQGMGQQFKIVDPLGNKIELRCYTGGS